MKKWYKVSINGHIGYPGELVQLEAPTSPAFDWRSWGYEPQGIEFELPAELFEKPYQADDFEIELVGDHTIMISQNTGEFDLEMDQTDVDKLRTYWIEQNFISANPYVWIKHIKLVITDPPFVSPVRFQLASELVGTKYEHDTMNLYQRTTSNDQSYTISKYAKTYVGAKVRVFEEDSTISGGYRLKFAGRLSEEPILQQPGVFHFIAKDEFDWMDIKVPNYTETVSDLRSIEQFLNPRYTVLSDFSKTEYCSFAGEVAELTNAPLTFGSHEPFDRSYFGGSEPGTFDTFKDAWVAYLKLSRQYLKMSQTKSISGVIEPEWELIDISDTITSSGEIDLISLLTINETMDIQLAPASSAAELNYLGERYVTKTTKKTIRGELDTFSLDLDENFIARPSSFVTTFTPDLWGTEYAEFFDSIYQVITIPSDTTILPDEIQPGNYYTIDSDSLEMISVFIDASISDWVFCVSRSDDEFIFWHVKDPT